MKKFLAILLALVMLLSLAACGNKDNKETTPSTEGNSNTTEPPATEKTEPTAPPVQAEELPENPLLHLSFEDATGLTAVHQVANTETPELTGATFGLAPSAHEILIAEGYGAAGNSLMLDGKYGVRVDNMPQTSDDSYTIAFWYAADRYSQFGPLLQVGRNVGMSDVDNEVTWINFTKTDAWSVEGSECAPVAWNRNSAENIWPWIGNNLDLQGKRDWVHVALVVTGETYKDDAGLTHVGATFYVNGVAVMSASAADIGLVDDAGLPINNDWKGVSPNILKGEGVYGVECLLGVNYWDQYSKEYIDEFYLYDEALTAGQIATLYGMGNAPAEYETMPKYEGPTDDDGDVEATEPAPLEAAPVDDSAIDTLGTPNRELGWWSDNTDGFELADGATLTLKLNNYSSGVSNWHNFVLALTNTAVTTDLIANADNYAGYAEYAVVRADAYGWGDAAYAGEYTCSWDGDWASWLALMTAAKVDVVLTRNGGVVTIDYTFTGADGTVMTETAVITSTLTADAPLYVHVGGESAYIELLSVE